MSAAREHMTVERAAELLTARLPRRLGFVITRQVGAMPPPPPPPPAATGRPGGGGGAAGGGGLQSGRIRYDDMAVEVFGIGGGGGGGAECDAVRTYPVIAGDLAGCIRALLGEFERSDGAGG